MLHIRNIDEGLEIFKALGSEIRIEIIKQLLTNNELSMKDLADRINITKGALTSHIKKLEEVGLIKVSNESNSHGNTKNCNVFVDRILIDLTTECLKHNVYEVEVLVGHYNDFDVLPTCGLATDEHIIGEVDDQRYFAHPERYNSQIIWFTRGYVEYIIPNFIPSGQKIDKITISAELSSEAPGSNDDWPSDIHFYINGTKIGIWTSPGDYGGIRGIFTPRWWETNWNQYGLLKQIVVSRKGTFIDGLKISNITTNDLDLDYRSGIKLRMEVPTDAKHAGGFTIFGKGFGNYNQDIQVRLEYSPLHG